MLDRLLSVVVALSLALLVWLYARSRDQEILDNVVVPVHVTLSGNQADTYSLEPSGPSEILASFTGSPSRIRELRSLVQRKELAANVGYVVLEEHQRKARYSDTVVVDARSLHIPSGVTVTIVDGRNRVPVTVQRQDLLENVVVPVHLKMPEALVDQFVVDLAGPAEVLATFTGPPAKIREVRSQLDAKTLQAVVTASVPAEKRGEGHYSDSLLVQSRDLVVPPGVTVTLTEGRDRVAVNVNKVIEKTLPVHLEGAGEETGGSVVIEPAAVTVRGPKDVLERARFIPAQPGMMPMASTSNVGLGAGRLTLAQELEGKPVKVTPRTVLVRLLPQNRQVYELTDVPIHFLTPIGFTLRPSFPEGQNVGKIPTLKVQGPPGLLELPRVHAYIDLTKPGDYTTGVVNDKIHLILPTDFVLAPSEKTSLSATFILLKPDVLPTLPAFGDRLDTPPP
jgi:hypothetical protein